MMAVHEKAAPIQAGPVVGEFHDDGPQLGMDDDGLEALVPGEPLRMHPAVFPMSEVLRRLPLGGCNVALDRFSRRGQLCFTHYVRNVQIAVYVEEISLFRVHRSVKSSVESVPSPVDAGSPVLCGRLIALF